MFSVMPVHKEEGTNWYANDVKLPAGDRPE
jgi:hypothetical protein